MCGLAGYISKKTTGLGEQLKMAAATLYRRGPDNVETVTKTYPEIPLTVGLAHTRLKIVDHDESSNQPYFFRNIAMVYNGEIYNHSDIRCELMSLGHHFRTLSDTEVLIKSYSEWGESCFEKFDGMWAVAIFDGDSKKLVLSRDRFGEKPLYYCQSENGIFFASTLRSIRCLTDIDLSLNSAAIKNTIDDGFNFHEESLYEKVFKLPCNCVKIFNVENFSLDSKAIGDLLPTPKQRVAFSIQKFEQILLDSLDRRLIADVPICLLLSGGIDSTYIAALAQRELNRDLSCITITDEVGGNIETDRAKRATKILGLEHSVIDVKVGDFVSLYERGLEAMDEPMCDPSFPMLINLISHVPEKYKVLVTGDGADELFLSYSNYRKNLHYQPNRLRLNENILTKLYEFGARLKAPTSRYFKYILDRCVETSSDDAFLNDLIFNGSDGRVAFIKKMRETEFENVDENFFIYFNAYFYELSEYLLVKTDQASMFHSREARSPFLNAELKEYVLSCNPKRLGLGNKDHVKERLKKLLGADLRFEKRGFFASGQKHLPKIRTEDQISEYLTPYLSKIHISAAKSYRLKVLNDWLANEV